jgi:methionine synthase I (cobalamin-dependent)
MAAAYEEQAAALIEGGVDVLLVETSQDLLQAKAALVGGGSMRCRKQASDCQSRVK